MNRWLILVIIGAVLLAVLIAVIAFLVINDRTSEPVPITEGADVESLLQGIPQQNNVLGDPNAPVTMVEYADLKCPSCAKFSTTTLNQIINDYVRTGKLRLVLKLQTFVNNKNTPGDTEAGARFALAVGMQNKMWNLVELHYKNQPPEDQRYFTDEYLTGLGNEIPGLDVEQALSEKDSEQVSQQLIDFRQAFSDANFDAVPSFQVGKTGETLTNLEIETYDYSVFQNAINELL